MARHFVGRPSLHVLRQVYVLRHEELVRRHSAEWDALRQAFEEEAAKRGGLTDQGLQEEWLAVVEEATPLPDEYDLTGLEEGDDG